MHICFRESDEVVRLKSQLGYLKSKLAKECPDANAVIDANDDSMPTIYAVTPTYARPVQKVRDVQKICIFGDITALISMFSC